jgi:hypothetical protein
MRVLGAKTPVFSSHSVCRYPRANRGSSRRQAVRVFHRVTLSTSGLESSPTHRQASGRPNLSTPPPCLSTGQGRASKDNEDHGHSRLRRTDGNPMQHTTQFCDSLLGLAIPCKCDRFDVRCYVYWVSSTCLVEKLSPTDHVGRGRHLQESISEHGTALHEASQSGQSGLLTILAGFCRSACLTESCAVFFLSCWGEPARESVAHADGRRGRRRQCGIARA